MTLLAIELKSLNSNHYTPIIEQTIQNASSEIIRVVLFMSPELRAHFDSTAKRAAQFRPLQQFVSAAYTCGAGKREISCDFIFADWCGYAIEQEVWDYEYLHVPQGIFKLVKRAKAHSPSRLDFTIAKIKQIGNTDYTVSNGSRPYSHLLRN
jgi:hypothetical protein